MKSNEAIQIKKKKKKENTFLFFKYHKTEKLNSQTNYQIMISQTVDGIKAIIWNRLSKKQIINNFKCKWGLSIRPEMKSTWNQISIHHKGSSVHTTFHCGRNKMKFRFTAGRRKAAHSVKEHHFYFDEIDVCANVLIHMINFW